MALWVFTKGSDETALSEIGLHGQPTYRNFSHVIAEAARKLPVPAGVHGRSDWGQHRQHSIRFGEDNTLRYGCPIPTKHCLMSI